MGKDYYNILGVNKNFTEDELKKAYKKSCLKYHPDRLAGKSDDEKKQAEEKFKDIQEAYECLSDPQKKAHYDRFGSMDGYGQGWSAGANFGNFSTFFDDFPSFEDIFSGHGFGGFGGHRQSRRNVVQPGQSIKTTIPVTIEQLFKGGTYTFKYKRNIRCDKCNGEGGTGVKTCQFCHGTGMITKVEQSAWGITQTSRPCAHCQGTGKTVENVCSECNGTGFKQIVETLEIQIPSGVANGASTIKSGMGHMSKNPQGSNGDLMIIFQYDWDNDKYAIDAMGKIYEQIPVPYYTCILGADIMRKLPNGKEIKIHVPEGSNNGTMITSKGNGIRGNDYIFVIAPYIPKSVSKEERRLLEKIAKLH